MTTREKLFKTSEFWGLEGDSAIIFEKLKNWETVSVETLHDGKQFTIKPVPLMKECADEIGSRGYCFNGRSPILNVIEMVDWVSRLKLAQ